MDLVKRAGGKALRTRAGRLGVVMRLTMVLYEALVQDFARLCFALGSRSPAQLCVKLTGGRTEEWFWESGEVARQECARMVEQEFGTYSLIFVLLTYLALLACLLASTWKFARLLPSAGRIMACYTRRLATGFGASTARPSARTAPSSSTSSRSGRE